jgi:murein tripeptide amidase MpaA
MSEHHFDRLFNYGELTEILQQFAESYPQLVTIEVIGQSYEGRDIRVATVTNSATGPAEEKPAIWFDGNIHAKELVSATACLSFIDRLVTGHGNNEEITRLLDKRTFYVCPRVNPDGAEAALADDPKFVRSSVRPYPYDEDPVEGIVSRDIDGDGRILSMRVSDRNGNWKKHAAEPRLMVRREPGEEGGDYYSLLNEGDLYHQKGDIYQHAPQKEGLDLNRNFPSWVPEAQQEGAGDAPLSEPEVRAMTDFIVSHKNISIAVYGHSFSGVLLRPSATVADTELPTSDLRLYKMMGEKGEEITGYPAFSTFHDYRYDPKSVIRGTENWFYETLGIISWTVEYWAPHRQAGAEVFHSIEWFDEHPVEDDLKMLHWSDEVLAGKGYVDWYPFDHPALGQVELGGWNVLQSIWNPPDHLIEKEITPVINWVLWLGALTPCLELYRAEIEALGEDTYRVEFVVENTGYMSTCGTERAAEGKVTREVVAEIHLPEGSRLIQGKTRENLGHLSGRSNVPAASFINEVVAVVGGSLQRAIVQWIVKAPKGTEITLVAKQPRSGTVRAMVSCE